MESVLTRDLSLMINTIGVGNCLLLSFVYLTANSKAEKAHNQVLSFLFFTVGMIILNTVLNFSGYSYLLPGFEPLSNAMTFAVAPLLYLYLRSNSRAGITASIWSVHLIHFFVFLGITLVTITLPETTLSNYGIMLIQGKAIITLWNCHFLAYLLAAYRVMTKNEKTDKYQNRLIFWGIASIWAFNLILLLYRNFFAELPELFYLNITLLFTILTLWLSYRKLQIPRLRGKRKNYLASGDLTRWIDNDTELIDKIYNQQYFRDPDLNIRKLSKHLQIPYHQLSIIINRQYNKNFNEFINGLRIRAVVNSLLNHEHDSYTILALAQESGFKSGSAFYSAFKKEKGTTPKSFMRNHRTAS